MSSSTLAITTQDIINDRATRKAAGLTGCITGRPVPELNFFGFSDVQSWRPSDPMNPHCFCFDCRDLWDRDGTIDLQLLQNGHEDARYAYRNLIPGYVMPRPTVTEVNADPVPQVIPQGVPTSLPPPIPRDIANESLEERIRNDLNILRGQLQSDLITTMDSRRRLAFYEPLSNRWHLESSNIDIMESALLAKIEAIDRLIY